MASRHTSPNAVCQPGRFLAATVGPFPLWPGLLALLGALWILPKAAAAVPPLLNYQGRVLVDGRVFDGTGRFKFALVNAAGSQTWWRSAPDGNGDGEPDAAVEIPVVRGLCALLLGDTRLANMAALPPEALEHDEVYLRVWFSDGTGAFERFVPDHQFAAAGFALVARTVEDGAITTAKLAPGAITAAQIPALDAAKLASGQLDPARLPAGVAQDADVDVLQAALTALTARVITLEAGGGGGPAGVLASRNPEDAALGAAGYGRFASFAPSPWRNGSPAWALSARSGHAAAWSGTGWLIWGGQNGVGQVLSSGAIYDPAADQWTDISTLSAPSARAGHSAVWTGTELLVWGGRARSSFLGSGHGYVPATMLWRTLQPAGAPSARESHFAAWCAGRMLVWGGWNGGGLLGDGALYDPQADAWTPLALPGAPEPRRLGALAVAGDSVFIWGGETDNGPVATGARLMMSAVGTPLEWRSLPAAGAPSARRYPAAVWTGTRLLVWGGSGPGGEPLADGRAYDPAADQWTPLPPATGLAARSRHGAVWTGTEMLIVGGEGAGGPLASGGAYDPAAGAWRLLTLAGDPAPRHSARTAWTGSEILIFGGGGPLADLERLDPAGAWHLFRKP